MIRRPPRSTRTDTLFPYTTLFRSESWIAIGLFLGAWANWVLVAPRLRAQTEQYDDSLTIPEFLGNRFADDSHILRIVASLVIVVFFAVYSASGLVAGGKLFETAFGFSYQTGLWVTASVVVAYVVLGRSEEHTSELQSLMRNSYAVFCLKKKKKTIHNQYILVIKPI